MIVPVLSEAIKVADPKVSKHSNFFINTCLAANLLAITVNIVVTVVGNPIEYKNHLINLLILNNLPSGTLAQITIINPLINVYNGSIPLDTPIMKNIVAIHTANLVINTTTWWISLLRLDSSLLVPETLAAILPINVLFPVLITTPIAYPS